MDRTDKRILQALQQDSAISNLDLAEQVGLSPSPCLRRVKALEETGIIQGYRALLDARKLGLTLMAFVHVSMDRHTQERFAGFETVIRDCDEVLECYLITGQAADYLIKVVVADMAAYQAWLLGRLTRIEGVTGVHSSFVMTKVVERTALPV